MRYWHLLRLLLHFAQGLLTCALVFPFAGALRRQQLIQRWSAKLLRICGVSVQVSGTAGAHESEPGLIIANHISWLDIFVINAHKPCRFVAKSDIRDWPLVGWLCEKSGTVFIARGRQRDVRRIYGGLVESIHAGERVAFFPEGTTAPQGRVLPFHANLFEAAIEAQAPIHPCAVRYLDPQGRLHDAADFVGDTSFAQSILNILAARDLKAELILLPPLPTTGAHRRELASASRAVVAAALGFDVGADTNTAAGKNLSPGAGAAGTAPETAPDHPV